jgi:MFS superfamily sulfate permease-like transporter
VVGELPAGLPSLALPGVPLDVWLALVLPAVGIALVAYSEALGVARELAEKHGYEVEPDQELNAHAAANLASSLLGGMIAAGSMSASAVKDDAGGRSQVANLVAWGVTLLTLLFLTPLFTNLPEAVLAALIIHAVWHILVDRRLQHILQVSRTEFWLAVVTLVGVLLIDVLEGMVLGLLFSLLLVIYRSSRPHIASLGRVPGVAGAYSDLARHPENTPVPGVLILRLDAPLYYANALTVRDRVRQMIGAAVPVPRAVILDAAVQSELDLTSAEVLTGLVSEIQGRGIAVYVAELHAPVLDFARRTSLLGRLGEDHVCLTLEEAVRRAEANT